MKKTTRFLKIGNERIARGETKDLRLKISETYTGDAITIPIRVVRSKKTGPVVFVTAAIHGDEINGTGIVHDLMFKYANRLLSGTLILIPVVNVFGFESHERYLPDRRDLNRSFPGSATGSLAARYAHTIMTEIVAKSDYGIDLHSAASQRTNFPNVRADLKDPIIRKLAFDFGCALVVDGKGPLGSFRRESCKAGCPTIILEAGEPLKMEPSVLEIGLNGVKNILIKLNMLDDKIVDPPYQTRITKTTWIRAKVGGILRFHVSAGDIVSKGQEMATNYSLLGEEQNILTAPEDGIILSIATLPAVKPGEPVCHLAMPRTKIAKIKAALDAAKSGVYQQMKEDLATSVVVEAREG